MFEQTYRLLRITIHKEWARLKGYLGTLGRPVSSPLLSASGEASVFANGCIIAGGNLGSKVAPCFASWPMIGTPKIVKASNPGTLAVRALRFKGVTGVSTATLRGRINDVYKDKLQLRPSAGVAGSPVNLKLRADRLPFKLPGLGTSHGFSLVAAGPLKDRTLYDICYVRPDRKVIVLSPNCVYAKNAWTDFGMMHVSDLHASRRTESFRAKLSPKSRLAYVNYNNGIRAMITEANKLHKAGELDAIIATGDLVDYVYEHNDNDQGSGNFKFLVDLLVGNVRTESGKPGPKLQVPMFMSLGNHDYRSKPYELYFTIDIRAWFDKTLSNFSSHNLQKADAIKIQGKKLKVSTGRAQSMAKIDKVLTSYSRTISRQRSYSVSLGTNRLIMVDSRWDAGTLTSWRAIVNALGFGTSDERNFADGHPNSVGPTKQAVAMMKSSLEKAKGAVIVGIHAPVINTAGNEYPYYFRETLRSHMTAKQLVDFHTRQQRWTGAVRLQNTRQIIPPKDWRHESGKHIKDGSRKGMDYGVSKGEAGQFLDVCAGVGVPRKVDLVLSGHAHKNVEYRIEKSSGKKHRYFMDFYTENPRSYYATKEKKINLHINIRRDARPGDAPARVRDHRNKYTKKEWLLLSTPPYARPLSETSRPKLWWKRHAPLFVQTSCLGPVDYNDRKPAEPKPSYRGYRHIRISNNAISSVNYKTISQKAGR